MGAERGAPPLLALSPLVDRALALAGWAHRGGERRSRPKPYLEHCVEVADLVVRYGVDDELTIASALLHDVLEDTDVTRGQLADLMPAEVVETVVILSEDDEPDAMRRKLAHLERLRDASARALTIFAADKLAGAADLLARAQEADAAGWPALGAPMADKLVALRAAVGLARLAPEPARRMLHELDGELDRLDRALVEASTG